MKAFLLFLFGILSTLSFARGVCTITTANVNRDLCEICATDTDGQGAALVDGVFTGTLVIGRDVTYRITSSCLSSVVFADEFTLRTVQKSHVEFLADPQVAEGTVVTAEHLKNNQMTIKAYGTTYQPYGNNGTAYPDFANRMMAGSTAGQRIVGSPAAATALPVTLTAWSATAAAGGIDLSWSTAGEFGSAYYGIERSSDGVVFTGLTRLNSRGAGTNATTYTYHDAPGGGTPHYRLIQFDLDGTRTAFPVLTVQLSVEATLAPAYPNPARGGYALRFTVPATANTAELYRMDGQRILSAPATGGEAGVLELPATLAPGTYLLRVGQHIERILVR
ncbi:T9SS type A sorting domain-containing protein [Lewinella sp. IMCC34183]|uniref:T9SS type A sorting domain-containing protein n=1 Tax=Lewinella sp. IMCC34183 TaxID=2248762 RepID=UPI000E2420E6|nr:T9SS type A sorting domain-containing protein [Lewinella sp. IMCC34183]